MKFLPEFNVNVSIPEHYEYYEWYAGSLIVKDAKLHWISKNQWEIAGKSYINAALSGLTEIDLVQSNVKDTTRETESKIFSVLFHYKFKYARRYGSHPVDE